MKVVHCHVDTEGRTRFDEFDSSIPLDMDTMPEVAHVILLHGRNAGMVKPTFEHCFSTQGREVLFVGSPAQRREEAASFDSAKTLVRRLCFENPAPGIGGLRRAGAYHIAHAQAVQASQQISEKYREVVRNAKPNQLPIVELDGEMTAKLSSHPLWKRMWWIPGVMCTQLAAILEFYMDPLWFVDPRSPDKSTFFVDALLDSNYNVPVIVNLVASASACSLDELQNAPEYFFIRYGLRALQCFPRHAARLTLVKFLDYVWLNWLAVLFPRSCAFDSHRFFRDESTEKEFPRWAGG